MNNFNIEVKNKVKKYKIPLEVLVSDLKKIGVNTSKPTIWRVINNVTDKCDYKIYLGLTKILMIGEPNALNSFHKYDFINWERV